MRNKLYELGCKTPEVEELIAELIEKNLLNEERYAIAYARGKYRIKRWGVQKITQGLKNNNISDYCISKALKLIDTGEYNDNLHKLAEKKLEEINTGTVWAKKIKLYRYLLQKGYSSTQITEVINKLLIEKDS